MRSTTGAVGYTNRGVIMQVDRRERKVKFSFNAAMVQEKHRDWFAQVTTAIGVGELNPQPYWGFDDLMYTAGSKLKNAFFVLPDHKWEGDDEYFHFIEVALLTEFSFDGFLSCIEDGTILMDFDARSHHNHGTKFRIRQNNWPRLYKRCEQVV